ncbi:hypothetical protein SISNIDRAFT_490230 [Sistotremastrum niveocremeum HHB9708]|uniref:Uncharacterized protein n=1 Tax=Sistotremastrum niveocremeum HHB9708 TaxID=1314777 RepID=A0A164P7B3_9AGAM|nr:hypothetical protein SISNIDRAFT_490230 [Sistotremastrum niveocremeum HHB9708]
MFHQLPYGMPAFSYPEMVRPWPEIARSMMTTSHNEHRLKPTLNREAILTSSAPDVASSPEDKLLHRLLCGIEKEAYRLGPEDGSTSFTEADQYVLDMQDKMWNSMALLRASVNRVFNRRVLIARLPDEVLAAIFEHYIVLWEEEQHGASRDRPVPDNYYFFTWFPLVYVCQTWRQVALNTPSLFTRLNLYWPSGTIDLYLRCGGTTLPLTLIVPVALSYLPAEYNGVEVKDQAHFLRCLIPRARDLTLTVGKPFFTDCPNGLDAQAPILRKLRLSQAQEPSFGPPEVETLGLRTRIFRDPPPLLEHLDLNFVDFTEDWAACPSLKSVSIRYGSYTGALPTASVFSRLSKLPALERLSIRESGWSPSLAQPEPATLNTLHTLTLSSMSFDNMTNVYGLLELPVLRQFNLYGFNNAGIMAGPWPQPIVQQWEWAWLTRLCKSAPCLHIALGEPNDILGPHVIGEIRMLKNESDLTPVIHITFNGNWQSEISVDTRATEHSPLFEILTHRFAPHPSSLTITGLGSMKDLPSNDKLNPFFDRCRGLTSITVKNCIPDGVVAALRTINRGVPLGAPLIQELNLPHCQVSAEDLFHLAEESKAAGRPIKTIDLRETTLLPLNFDVGMLGHEFRL